MIVDKLSNLSKYFSPEQARLLLENMDKYRAVPKGEYPIDDNLLLKRVYSSTKTKDNAKIESHKLFADLQAPLDKEELYAIWDIGDLEESTSYDSEKDVVFYRTVRDHKSLIYVKPGEFILLEPGEIHQPQIAQTEPEPIEKIVFKIRR